MQRKPTMNDVARAAGVGTMTVSRVLNGSQHVSPGAAERVRAAVAQLGYHPNEMARALRNYKSRTIGLLLPNLHDTFYANCAHALNLVAQEHDYTVLLTITNDDSVHEFNEAQRMMQRHVEGLIVIPASSELCRLGDREFRDIPVVSLDRPLLKSGEAEVDSVITDNESGACAAVRRAGFADIFWLQLRGNRCGDPTRRVGGSEPPGRCLCREQPHDAACTVRCVTPAAADSRGYRPGRL
jgi:LacI family transcriptional regulator